MSAFALIEMLKRIDYPGAKNLDPHSLDWAFEDQSTLSFMQWVCSISKENVLSKEEFEEFEKLEKAGKVLTGSQLEEALKVCSCSEDKDDNSNLQSDVEQLEHLLQQVEERRIVMEKENSQLDVKQVTLKSKLSKLEDLISKAKRTCEELVNSCSIQSSKTDDVLVLVTNSVRNVSELYKSDVERGNRSGRTSKNVDAVFLSSVDLSQYHLGEEKYSQDLTAFTKKRFFEGMADIAGQGEKSQYSILDVSSPENISVDNSESDTFLDDCQEFALLQQIFPQSEINRLNALVNAKRAMFAVQEAKNILHLLKTDQFPTSASSISHCEMKAEENIRQAQDDASQYDSVVPDLVNQLGTLQGTEILTGDYDLKLRRQDYFTKNQDRVIEYLESQRSRSELLIMLYELELKFHEKTHHLLSAAEKTLQRHLQDWNQRMKCLDDPDLNGARFEHSVVDARDTSCNRIYQMMAKLSPNAEMEDQHLYLPLEKVQERASSFCSTFETSQTSQNVGEEALKENMSELEDCVKKCETALYAGSSTSAGLPNLSPADVQASMVSLQAQISSLRSNVDRVVTDVKNKKKLLKGNPMLCKERELFTLFHTKPERLISVINGLEEKLKI